MAQNPHNDFDQRTSQLGQALDGLKFPANKSEIVRFARSHQLNSETLATITNLPDRPYQDLRDVLEHFLGGTDHTESEHETSGGPPD